MKTSSKLLLPAIGLFLLAGCSSHSSTVNEASAALTPMESCVKYEIAGDAEGEAKTAVLFGFIHFGDDTSGSIGNGPHGFFNSVDETKSSAIYNAIESSDGADAILAPRYTEERTGFTPIFYIKKATVKGKAIKYTATKCHATKN